MAIRFIVTKEAEILRKECKKVEKFDERLSQLLDDLKDTLAKANGVGLAAPQVGIMRQVAIVDTEEEIIELVNPTILTSAGTQRDIEGCLSCPKLYGYVTRPFSCTVKAQDRHGNFFEKNLEEMACRCACHEIDHLHGKLFLDIVEEMVEVEED